MKKYTFYLLDLDGTLVDSRRGIISSFRTALARFGIKENDEDKLNSFIGPPIHTSLSTAYGLNPEQIIEAIALYRKAYAEGGVTDVTIYPHTVSTLKKLKNQGAGICLATSKPIVFASQIIENLGLTEYFDFLTGADLEGKFCEKNDLIDACLKRAKHIDKREMLMVGDRKYDILGAKYHGLDSAGVLCGYGSREELSSFGADYILDDISGLVD